MLYLQQSEKDQLVVIY